MTWVRPQAIHITLRFLGDVPESSLESLNAWTSALADITAAPFSVGPLNAFPNQMRPRTIFLDVSPHEPFLKLYERLDAFLSGIGIKPEDRPYHPHLTIGRVKSPLGKPPAIPSWTPLPGVLDSIVLFQSRLTPQGPIYTKLASVSSPP